MQHSTAAAAAQADLFCLIDLRWRPQHVGVVTLCVRATVTPGTMSWLRVSPQDLGVLVPLVLGAGYLYKLYYVDSRTSPSATQITGENKVGARAYLAHHNTSWHCLRNAACSAFDFVCVLPQGEDVSGGRPSEKASGAEDGYDSDGSLADVLQAEREARAAAGPLSRFQQATEYVQQHHASIPTKVGSPTAEHTVWSVFWLKCWLRMSADEARAVWALQASHLRRVQQAPAKPLQSYRALQMVPYATACLRTCRELESARALYAHLCDAGGCTVAHHRDSWNRLADMPKAKAETQYVQTVEAVCPAFRQAPSGAGAGGAGAGAGAGSTAAPDHKPAKKGSALSAPQSTLAAYVCTVVAHRQSICTPSPPDLCVRSVVDDGNHDVFYHILQGNIAPLRAFLDRCGDVNARVRRGVCGALPWGAIAQRCPDHRTRMARRCCTLLLMPTTRQW